jgi:hypothetical protein
MLWKINYVFLCGLWKRMFFVMLVGALLKDFRTYQPDLQLRISL